MQPVKRGLSLEEKRAKLLEVFHETKDVFVLKVRLHVCEHTYSVIAPSDRLDSVDWTGTNCYHSADILSVAPLDGVMIQH